ncbi:MAG TPA: hypothetical protein VIM12_02195 [Noviherbaspirillum sp.]|jgi:uncharacterized membrane protein YagU involved in acid resistance|uniref:hypothetical protein n=1 Tax=Noviherbaspirillum sp. TaxID=1926288 RepID=UPI002F9380D0
MDMHLHGRQWIPGSPDWAAAAIGGFIAGAVLMVIELLWSAGNSASSTWTASHMVAGIAMGADVAGGTGFDVVVVAVALVTHYVLGIVFGLILAAFMAPFHLDASIGMTLATGAVAGVLLYLFNFHGMTLFFPWFAAMRGGSTLLAHMIFGIVAAWMYLQLERRPH